MNAKNKGLYMMHRFH